MTYSIRAANHEDLKKISQIHIEAFPDFTLSKFGKNFIYYYYSLYLDLEEVLLVCTENQGDPIGFLAGVKDENLFYKYMKKKWFLFFLPLIRNLFNIKILIMVFNRAYNVIKLNKVNDKVEVPSNYHELTSIGILPVFEGRGIGRLLMDKYTKEIEGLGEVDGIFLTTDYEENNYVLSFYKGLGFKKLKVFTQFGNRKMIAFIREFRN